MVNMKILDLPLKAKWYEMIESGNKKEEYREIKKYWIGRLAKCGGRNSYEKTGFYCKKRIRFGCDTPGQIAEVERASALIDKYGYKGEYFLYCILMDFKESFARVNYWKSKSRRFLPHCQPFRDLNNPHQIIPQWQKDMAHWADRKEIYMSCDFKDFSPRKGFLCKEYFKML